MHRVTVARSTPSQMAEAEMTMTMQRRFDARREDPENFRLSREDVCDPVRGATVPARWYLVRLRPGRQDALRDLADPSRIESEQGGRAQRDVDGTLGVVPERETRDAQERRLLLDAAGVREHTRRVADERE